jgi:putative DNA primase/helicase
VPPSSWAADPTDLITKSVAAVPANTAECPRFLTFLLEANGGNQETIRFLQRWCGYLLTGETREHVLVFICGDGGTGKTVFLNTVTGIMNDYAVTAPMETFTSGQFDRHPTELAMMRGARLVTATETEEGRPWAEAKVKQLTGGDPVSARVMRGDFFTYRPQFKLMFAGNHLPVLHNIDNSYLRRFRTLPFSVKPASPDPHLFERLKEEWPQILRWMIDGCVAWQTEGLPVSRVVSDATTAYFSGQDAVSNWLDEACEIGGCTFRDGSMSSALFGSWNEYAKSVGENARTNKWLSSDLERRGFIKRSTNRGVVFDAIRLRKKGR